MSDPILHILQHALGRDEHGQFRRGAKVEYRNHFVAGGDDMARCREAVAKGWMTERPASTLTGGDPLFTVTEAGRYHVLTGSPEPPKLTRGQQRYREWMRSECGLTFGEWLGAKAVSR